jgi:hypothetical protein
MAGKMLTDESRLTVNAAKLARVLWPVDSETGWQDGVTVAELEAEREALLLDALAQSRLVLGPDRGPSSRAPGPRDEVRPMMGRPLPDLFPGGDGDDDEEPTLYELDSRSQWWPIERAVWVAACLALIAMSALVAVWLVTHW